MAGRILDRNLLSRPSLRTQWLARARHLPALPLGSALRLGQPRSADSAVPRPCALASLLLE